VYSLNNSKTILFAHKLYDLIQCCNKRVDVCPNGSSRQSIQSYTHRLEMQIQRQKFIKAHLGHLSEIEINRSKKQKKITTGKTLNRKQRS